VNPPDVPKKNWPRDIQSLEESLRRCLGVNEIPLAYVVWSALDPVIEPAGGWPSRQDELIDRAPIPVVYNQNFLTDRTEVWEPISAITRGLEHC
jgi:hypothetical protein